MDELESPSPRRWNSLSERNGKGKGTGFLDIRFIALILQFLMSVSFNLMGSFLPLFIHEDLNYTLIEATKWTGICQLVSSSLYAVTAPFWGFMCDRIGTKKVLIMAIAGNCAAYAGMTVSTNIEQIIIFRALQGSFGGVSTVMFVLVALVVPPTELRTALSYQMAAMTMGQLVGPGLGGTLVSFFGYRFALGASSIIFLALVPMIFMIKMPSSTSKTEVGYHFGVSDLKVILPDAVALILVYACMTFITPTIPWFLNTLGIPSEQLVLFTTLTTTLNGLAFGIATPFLTKMTNEKLLPILSVASAAVILMTSFVTNPYQFIALRIIIGSVQAGVPPNLLGGKSGRKGTAMGILNSARFIGFAIGPYMATSILGDGTTPRPLYMYTTMAVISLISAMFLYITHTRRKSNTI
ncbi:MAG: Multidrug efflux transporter [Thermoproteota archaeon]|nr:Multidrug efflux transporter [Thermoproteota archaeon]